MAECYRCPYTKKDTTEIWNNNTLQSGANTYGCKLFLL